MAGERKGKLYEALVLMALRELKRRGKLAAGEIYWNEKPTAMSIEPDFTIGSSPDSPHTVVLVTHSGSARNSDMKFWRNMGELVEAKTLLPAVPRVYNIVFDSEVKQDLKIIQAVAFDGQLVVGDAAYGNTIQRWVDENLGLLPYDDEKKLLAISHHLATDTGPFRKAVKQLVEHIGVLLVSTRPEMNKLWAMQRARASGKAPAARDTFVRRGLTKAALIGEIPKSNKIQKHFPAWMVKMGLVSPALGGYRIVDPELLWVTSSRLRNVDLQRLLDCSSTVSFSQQIEKLRSISLLEEFTSYVVKNFDELKTKKGMLKHLLSQSTDPSNGITIPAGIEPPTTIWLFDFVGALIKAKLGRAQGFGYSHFAKHPQAKRSRIGNMDIGTWCSCFMNQFINRKESFRPPALAIAFIAEVLAEYLSNLSLKDIKSLTDQVLTAYISKEYEATLLAHRGFDPIGGLLELHTGEKSTTKIRVRGAFAERALTGGGSGATSVLQVRNTLINWQSAHGSHTNDKKKEICGRAVALRYTWNPRLKQFAPRSGVKKLIMILDGTWGQNDLDILVRAGWDEIFYPDEMSKVISAIE